MRYVTYFFLFFLKKNFDSVKNTLYLCHHNLGL